MTAPEIEYHADLDRDWKVNGQDVATALGQNRWAMHDGDGWELVGKLKFPDEVARVVLEEAGLPLDGQPGVTVKQLADALDGFYLHVRAGSGHSRGGAVADPEEVARDLHARLILRQACSPDGDRGGLPGVRTGNAVNEAVERCRAALSWLSPDNREHVVSELLGDQHSGG